MQREVQLEEMLAARDHRIERQREFLEEYRTTLICFTMNIAGPVKYTEQIRLAFHAGLMLLRRTLSAEEVRILKEETREEATGCEAFLAVSCAPESAKRLTTAVEDGLPAGRLFDMDVLRPDGRKVDRRELGLPVRRCLICGKPARECARNRTHSVAELQERTRELIEAFLTDLRSEKIAELAVRSLLYEVGTTPKPGLVDRNNNGSHRDMDVFTFFDSAAALWPYYRECGRIGCETREEPAAETFRRLRRAGLLAEGAMRASTRGVNTHKGAIFTLGVVAGALGRLSPEAWGRPDTVLEEAGNVAREALKDFAEQSPGRGAVPGEAAAACAKMPESGRFTAGELYYRQYGVTGVRGQAAAGFPAVRECGLPVLEAGVQRGMSLNDAGAAALLHLIAGTEDTNLIRRGGRETQQKAAEDIRKLLRGTAFPAEKDLAELDRKFTGKNLSPGGSADLLAVSFFLYFLADPGERRGLV